MYQDTSNFGSLSYYGKQSWQPCSRLLASIASLRNVAGLGPLWKCNGHAVRYVGVIDLDLDCEGGQGKVLFLDSDFIAADTLAVKKAFYARYKQEQGDLQRLAEVCPLFRKVWADYQAITQALEDKEIPFVGYFSGGKGFHVYAFTDFFFQVPAARGKAGLCPVVKAWLTSLGCGHVTLDPAVYAGILKTDVRQHPDSKLWPCLVRESKAYAVQEDTELSQQLLDFWRWAATAAEKQMDSAPRAPLEQDSGSRVPRNKTPSSPRPPRSGGIASALDGTDYDKAERAWVEAKFGKVIRVRRLDTRYNTVSYELASRECVQRGNKHASHHGQAVILEWKAPFNFFEFTSLSI